MRRNDSYSPFHEDVQLIQYIAPEDDIAPGVYEARSGAQAFGVLRALVEAGQARQLGEHYLSDGEKAAVFAVDLHVPNQAEGEGGSLLMGPEFFASAIDDYRNWREGWWREAIQNGVDAGATEIQCSVTEQSDGTQLIVCEDNGSGMDRDTLRNVFMKLKGTAKRTSEGTGGFGEAKRLLVLPWISYEMHTRDTLMRGSGATYTTFPAEYKQGTRLSVVMPADNCTAADAAIAYIAKCYLPQVRFTVNGERVRANLKVGEPIRSLEDVAELYYDKKKAQFDGLVVRMVDVNRGSSLAMFTKYIPSEVKGQLILEIRARSTEVLTSNRDGFRGNYGSVGRRLEEAIDRYVSQLSADVTSALKKKLGLVKKKFLGTGKFRTEDQRRLQSTMLDQLGSMEPQGPAREKGSRELSDAQLDSLVQAVNQFMESGGEAAETTVYVDHDTGQPIGPGEQGGFGMRSSAEMVAAMLSGVAMRGSQQIEAVVKQLAWEPDFYLVNEIEGYKVPKKFSPEHMTAGLRKLLRCWAELCRFVLIQLGSTEEFGVGFVIDSSVAAEYLQDEGHWLMLNPFVKTDPRDDDEVFSVSDWEHVMWLYAAAVHECTHMADGISYHNESFAAALTRNFAKTSGKDKQIKAIKRVVLSEEKKLKEKLPKRERKTAQGHKEVSRSTFLAEVPWPTDFAPVYRGSLKGALLRSRVTGHWYYEYVNLDTSILYRREVGDGAELRGLSSLFEEAYSKRDMDQFLAEKADVYTQLDYPTNEITYDRWGA